MLDNQRCLLGICIWFLGNRRGGLIAKILVYSAIEYESRIEWKATHKCDKFTYGHFKLALTSVNKNVI